MPAAIAAGVDLVALCGVLVLIGMLIAVRSTFAKLADLINVSVFHSHPFASVAKAIENTIVEACNRDIAVLGGVAHQLWRGLKWSVALIPQMVMKLANATDNALDWLRHNALPMVIKITLAPIHLAIVGLEAGLKAVGIDLAREVTRLDTKIDNLRRDIAGIWQKDIASAVRTVEHDLTVGLNHLETTIANDIRGAISTAEGYGTSALDKLRAAEDAAIGSIKSAEEKTAGELRGLINNLPLTDIASVVAAVPLVVEAVRVLEAETGLGRAECRAKFRGICGTDPTQWTRLLEGLVLIGLSMSIEEMIRAAAEFGKLSEHVIRDLAQG